MQHLSRVYSGDSGSLMTSKQHDYLCDAVDFCNKNTQAGDKCEIVEAFDSLTGIEEHSTIMTWVREKDPLYA